MNRRFISRVRQVSPRLFPIIRTRSENNFSNFRFRAKRIFFEIKEYDSRALNARRILKKNLLVRELIWKINLSGIITITALTSMPFVQTRISSQFYPPLRVHPGRCNKRQSVFDTHFFFFFFDRRLDISFSTKDTNGTRLYVLSFFRTIQTRNFRSM